MLLNIKYNQNYIWKEYYLKSECHYWRLIIIIFFFYFHIEEWSCFTFVFLICTNVLPWLYLTMGDDVISLLIYPFVFNLLYVQKKVSHIVCSTFALNLLDVLLLMNLQDRNNLSKECNFIFIKCKISKMIIIWKTIKVSSSNDRRRWWIGL